jgi:hypothetical protein
MNKTLLCLPSCLANTPKPASKIMDKTLPYLPSCLAKTQMPALIITSRYEYPTDALDSVLSPLAPLSPLSPCNKSLPLPISGCGRLVELSSIGSYEENEDSLTPLSPLLASAPLPFTIFPYESTLWGMMKAKFLPIHQPSVEVVVPSLEIPVLKNVEIRPQYRKRFGHSRGRAKKRV